MCVCDKVLFCDFIHVDRTLYVWRNKGKKKKCARQTHITGRHKNILFEKKTTTFGRFCEECGGWSAGQKNFYFVLTTYVGMGEQNLEIVIMVKCVILIIAFRNIFAHIL